MRSLLRKIKQGWLYVAIFLALIIYKLIAWATITFDGLSLEKIIFHLNVPLTGTETSVIKSAFTYVMPSVLLLLGLFIVSEVIIRLSEYEYSLSIRISLLSDREFTKVVSLSSLRRMRKLLALSTILLVVLSGLKAEKKLDLSSAIKYRIKSSTFIKDNYVDAKDVLSFPENKRNLIHIYLESMENTYASKEVGGAFENNLIPELTDLAKQHVSFSNTSTMGGFYQEVGTGWTIAGMFAQSTGLPLKLPIDGNAMSQHSTFFPGVVSLGDILEEQGYSNNLLIGSDASFGGRKNFYEQHGNFNIYDYNYAKENNLIKDDYKVFWGYEDRKLFSFAKDILLDLASNDEPFNLTMLTVDTHFEDGYLDEYCPKPYDDQYSNVMVCSSQQVASFVDWISRQDFYEQTTIVITGDHQTMDKDFLSDIDSDYQRTMFNAFINSGFTKSQLNTKNRSFNSFDMFPTILASLDVEIADNRLGLGTNLFSEKETLSEIYGNELGRQLSMNSTYYTDRFLFGKDVDR